MISLFDRKLSPSDVVIPDGDSFSKVDYFSEPPLIHFLQELRSNGDARGITYHGVDVAVRAKGSFKKYSFYYALIYKFLIFNDFRYKDTLFLPNFQEKLHFSYRTWHYFSTISFVLNDSNAEKVKQVRQKCKMKF